MLCELAPGMIQEPANSNTDPRFQRLQQQQDQQWRDPRMRNKREVDVEYEEY